MAGGVYRAVGVGAKMLGVTGSKIAQINAIAKENGQNAPYCIPNELICSGLGRMLGLPVPPSGIITFQAGSQQFLFASLDFNITGNMLPPVVPAQCTARLPDHSTGLILFDILVANLDRHAGNLAVDFSQTPPMMSIFDHSHALLGYHPGQGLQRLKSMEDRLGISAGPVTQGNRHCLIDHIATFDYFEKWLSRIEEFPRYMVEDLCDTAVGFGINQSEAQDVAAFLCSRTVKVRRLVQDHRQQCTSIQQWGLTQP